MTFAHCNPFAGHDMLLGHDMSCPYINLYTTFIRCFGIML